MAATKTLGCWRCGAIQSFVHLILICSSNANQLQSRNTKVTYPIQNRASRVYTYENWKDWHKWQAPQEITDSFPLYQSGYDMEGLPVYVIEYGKWNYRALAESHDEMGDMFYRYFEQSMRRMERDSERNGGQGIVLIVDWKGFNLGQHDISEAARLALEMFSQLTRIRNAVKYGYFLHTNTAAETFIETTRPFMSDILDKFEVYGMENDLWRSALHERIPTSQLPIAYGGNNRNFQPVGVNG